MATYHKPHNLQSAFQDVPSPPCGMATGITSFWCTHLSQFQAHRVGWRPEELLRAFRLEEEFQAHRVGWRHTRKTSLPLYRVRVLSPPCGMATPTKSSNTWTKASFQAHRVGWRLTNHLKLGVSTEVPSPPCGMATTVKEILNPRKIQVPSPPCGMATGKGTESTEGVKRTVISLRAHCVGWRLKHLQGLAVLCLF
jgi:hypothetical protein